MNVRGLKSHVTAVQTAERARMRHRKAFASFTLVSCLCIRFHAWSHSGCSKRRRNRVDPYIRTKSTEIRMLRHLLTLCRCNLSTVIVLLEIEFDYLRFLRNFYQWISLDVISFQLLILLIFLWFNNNDIFWPAANRRLIRMWTKINVSLFPFSFNFFFIYEWNICW